MGFNDIDIKVSGGSDIISTLQTYTTRILKPNIVDGKNVLTQEMLNSKNTKYVIKYVYDLLGTTLTMPQNVILEFDGGSIKNGTLVGNDTLMLNTNETESVLDNVTLGGTWKESSYDLVEEVVADKAPGDGMGRIILRKDKTFAEQLTQENTIYVIRYDFELDGDVTIPANCILQFEGGSLSGEHTITGNNTGIQAGLVKIFDTDITLAGTWNVTEAYPEWFGAKGDGVTDDYESIKKCIDGFPSVLFIGEEYYINCYGKDSVFYINTIKSIKCRSNQCTLKCDNLSEQCKVFDIDCHGFNMENVHLKNINEDKKGIGIFHCRTFNHSAPNYWSPASHLDLKNCVFSYFYTGVDARSYLNQFRNCRVEYCNTGFSVTSPMNASVTSNIFTHCSAAHNVIGYSIDKCIYSLFEVCTGDDNQTYCSFSNSSSINVIGCGAEGNTNLFSFNSCYTFTLQGCYFITNRNNRTKDSIKNYIATTNSDTILFNACVFSFIGVFTDESQRIVPIIFTLGNPKYGRACVILDTCEVVGGDQSGDFTTQLFDNSSDLKVIITNVKGAYKFLYGTQELPNPTTYNLNNVSGAECYNLRMYQKNYLFKGKWVTSEGYTVTDAKGNDAASRPTNLESSDSILNHDVGFKYFDTSLNCPIFWNGRRWVDSIGADVTGIDRRKGTTDQRIALDMSTTPDRKTGFCYFDTTLGKPIWWNGTAWVDATGTQV